MSKLKSCTNEAIAPLESASLADSKKLLAKVKTDKLSSTEAKKIGLVFDKLLPEKIEKLATSLFEIYIQSETTSQTQQNVRILIPKIWARLDEYSRHKFGIKYTKLVGSNEREKEKLAREFLQVVSGLSYIPEGIRTADIETTIANLLVAHRGTNNFHKEHIFARKLEKLLGRSPKILPQVDDDYVHCLVEVFVTNGKGVAWLAEDKYKSMLARFNSHQALIAILSFTKKNIANRLKFSLCQQKFRELLEIVKNKVTMPAAQELINELQYCETSLDKIKDDSRIKRKVKYLRQMLAT